MHEASTGSGLGHRIWQCDHVSLIFFLFRNGYLVLKVVKIASGVCKATLKKGQLCWFWTRKSYSFWALLSTRYYLTCLFFKHRFVLSVGMCHNADIFRFKQASSLGCIYSLPLGTAAKGMRCKSFFSVKEHFQVSGLARLGAHLVRPELSLLVAVIVHSVVLWKPLVWQAS